MRQETAQSGYTSEDDSYDSQPLSQEGESVKAKHDFEQRMREYVVNVDKQMQKVKNVVLK